MSLRGGVLPSAVAMSVWGLAAVFLLAAASPNLQACDGGTAVPDPENNPGLVADCKVLLEIRDELGGTPYWLNWAAGLAITSWQGIRVSGLPSRVTVLRLHGTELTGTIPSELGQLLQLRSLSLHDNQLTGVIPSELGQLTKLSGLGLGGNQLTGVIPVELAQLSKLQYLYLNRNQLTGVIPAELGQLARLEVLWLDRNQLTGEIPAGLGQLYRLSGLYLHDNQLTGVIPPELGQLRRLIHLYLSGNQLTGEIPPQLGQLSRLKVLWLSSNQLTGEIPAELGQLSQLSGLYLDDNQLTGVIPPELGQLSQLNWLTLRNNQLTGEIPEERHDVSNLAAIMVAPGQMKVTWDVIDSRARDYPYEYRLSTDLGRTWSDWTPIEETPLTAGEELTIELMLMGLPADIAYTDIRLRRVPQNNYNVTLADRARVGPLADPGDTPESDPLITLYFPDYVDGGGWSVQLALSHIAAAAEDAEIIVTAYDREGQPIPGFFDPEGTFGIPPLGTRILRSAGLGEIRRGWIEVQTDTASVSGLLTYRNAATGLEVSVEPAELARHFALFVEESSDIGTGLAIFKPDPASRIEFRIRDEDGANPLGEGFARVGDFNQAARTIPEWFDADGIDTEFLKDFRGVLFLRAEDGSSFAPLGLRFGKQGESLSAVPMIRVTTVPE